MKGGPEVPGAQGSRRRRERLFLTLLATSIGVCWLMTSPSAGAHDPGSVELDLHMHWWGTQVQEAIDQALRRFEALNPGIKVNKLVGGPDAVEVQVLGGAPPDVTHVSMSRVARWADAGLLMPLDDELQRSGIFNAVHPGYWPIFQHKGRTYAVPALETGPRLALVWNNRILDEAGIGIRSDEVLTWETFLDAASKLTRYDAAGNVERIGYDPREDEACECQPKRGPPC